MSLIELVVSMGLAILLISSVVIKSNTSYLQTDQTARILCSDIRYIKTKSIAGKRKYRIKITQINNQSVYQIWGDRGIEKTVKVKEGIKIVSNTNTIRFRPDATPDKGCTIYISYKNYKKIITITPISGRVLLKEDIYRE